MNQELNTVDIPEKDLRSQIRKALSITPGLYTDIIIKNEVEIFLRPIFRHAIRQNPESADVIAQLYNEITREKK